MSSCDTAAKVGLAIGAFAAACELVSTLPLPFVFPVPFLGFWLAPIAVVVSAFGLRAQKSRGKALTGLLLGLLPLCLVGFDLVLVRLLAAS